MNRANLLIGQFLKIVKDSVVAVIIIASASFQIG